MSSLNPARLRARSFSAWLVATVAAVVLVALPANATGPGHYSISSNAGATFAQFSSNNLVSGQADDVVYYLSTTGTGLQRLPFVLHAYNRSFNQIAISTNGNVQLGVPSGGGNTTYSNDCLPSAQFAGAVVMPFWDDLFFDSNDRTEGYTEGVFVKTKGSAPHRKFVISWQGHLFSSVGSQVQAQVVFSERSQTISYIYGRDGGASTTIGIQAANQTAFTQFTCNSGLTPVVSGLKLTLLHSN